MFAYCGNNPVISSDTAGMRPSWEHKSGGTTQYTDTGTGTAYAPPGFVHAPGGCDVTIAHESNIDRRLNYTEYIAYYTAEQTHALVEDERNSRYTDSEVASILFEGAASYGIGMWIEGAGMSSGVGTGFSFISLLFNAAEEYGRVNKARCFDRIDKLGHGMVMVEIRGYGGYGGVFYIPWDGSERDGKYGSYPYAKIS